MSYYRRYGLVIVSMAAMLLLGACKDQQAKEEAMPTVTYLEVTQQSIELTTELPGRTSAFMISEVRPQVSGIIQQRLFTEGEEVSQGDVLYQIDPALYQAAYANAEAALKKAEANVRAAELLAQRYYKIVRLNAVSKQEYDNAVASKGQAEAEVEAAKAALRTARINLDYTKVTAPVSGIIGRSSITPGALVTQNQAAPLATVQQLDPIYVDVTQSSSEMLRLRRALLEGSLKSAGIKDMPVTLKLEDGTPYKKQVLKKNAAGEAAKNDGGNAGYDEDVVGQLKFFEPTVDQSTGMVTFRAIFPNPDKVLLPGMYVRAKIQEGTSSHAILIPQKAVSRNNRGLPVVQVLVPVTVDADGKMQRIAGEKLQSLPDGKQPYAVEPRIISVDRSIDNEWLVLDGLKAGERILINGAHLVKKGKPVLTVLEGSSPAGQSTPPANPAGSK